MRHQKRKEVGEAAVSRKRPLVSVMIPTYCRPDYCELAVMSALRQDYPALEVIVCDNSPDEDTAERLEPYMRDKRFRYVRNREAKCKADNFVPFEHLARGEYLQWLMDDDMLLPGKLSLMAQVLQSRPDVTLVTSNRRFMDGSGRRLELELFFSGVPEPYGVSEGKLLGQSMLMRKCNSVGEPSTVLFRRQDLRHHYWRADCRGYLTISDVVMWLELLEKGNCAVFAKPLSAFRVHEGQEGARADVSLLAQMEWFQLGEEYYARRIFLTKPDEYMAMLRLMLSEYDGVAAGCRKRVSPQAWRAYEECMGIVRERLRQLEQSRGTEG